MYEKFMSIHFHSYCFIFPIAIIFCMHYIYIYIYIYIYVYIHHNKKSGGVFATWRNFVAAAVPATAC